MLEMLISIPVAIFWLQLNVYHEARGESELGRRLVVHTVLERVERRKRSVRNIITAKSQYSWYNSGMKSVKKPLIFLGCYPSVMAALKERINGINYDHIDHYFNPKHADPDWQHDMVFIKEEGNHKFFKSSYWK